MRPRWSTLTFSVTNLVVWIVMIAILVVVPDSLERWLSLEIARVVGWTVACAVWVVSVERQWQERLGPFVRFFLQLALWVSAALVAIWISDQTRVR
jgi:hypothetical protein